MTNDISAIREVRARFEEDGFRVDAFSDPELGLRSICERRFDVVLLDLDLTGTGAISIARELRERPASPLPLLIFLTSDEDSTLAALQYGADHCTMRPVNWAGLERLLRNGIHTPGDTFLAGNYLRGIGLPMLLEKAWDVAQQVQHRG